MSALMNYCNVLAIIVLWLTILERERAKQKAKYYADETLGKRVLNVIDLRQIEITKISRREYHYEQIWLVHKGYF